MTPFEVFIDDDVLDLLHLVAMNVVLGGSILALHWRASRRAKDAQSRAALLRVFAKALPVAVAAAVTLGVAPLLFVQVLYGRLFFTSSVLMAWLWLAVVPILIVAYYGTYRLAYRGDAAGRPAPVLGALVAILLMGIAFLYVSNMSLMLRPDTFIDAFRASGRGFHTNLGDPTFVPRYLHLLLGAVAVCAPPAPFAFWLGEDGTITVQIPAVGLWLTGTLSPDHKTMTLISTMQQQELRAVPGGPIVDYQICTIGRLLFRVGE